MLERGRVVGGYRVEGVLGQGAMGEVYRVVSVERGTTHALKYLPLPSRKVRQRLLREAEAQTRLSHPNVVTLTEVIDVDGDPGLVMEYVDGPSLSAWLEHHQASLQEAEALFRAICAGVGHAHRRGLVHRDLKPANVLLARTAHGLVPKVADFGIAKVVDSSRPDVGNGALTRTGTSLGSPAYMAPEQIRDARTVDQSADIFSLGCILYELACGRRAFEGPDVLAVLNAASACRYPSPREIRPDLPERFVRTIEACLKPDPDERADSVETLLSLLSEGGAPTAVSVTREATPLADSSAGTRPPPASSSAGLSPERLIVGVVGVGILLLVVLAAVVFYLQ